MAEPRHGGVYTPNLDENEIKEAGERAAMAKNLAVISTPIGPPLSLSSVLSSLRTEVQEKMEPRRGGAYEAKDVSAVDSKPAIDKLCHEKCPYVWEEYEKCSARIEKKVSSIAHRRTQHSPSSVYSSL